MGLPSRHLRIIDITAPSEAAPLPASAVPPGVPAGKAKKRRGPVARALKTLLKGQSTSALVGWYLGVCSRTARWEIHGALPQLQALAAGSPGFVMVFWHECLPLMSSAWTRFWSGMDGTVARKPGLVLVSESRDGAMIARELQRYGLTAVTGSSSHGGRAAALGLLRGVRQGAVAVVVPDGPRGPRRVMSEGGLRLAAMAGVPLVPCAAYATPSRRLRSWDRMILPLPFARCVAIVGAPILPDEAAPAELCARLAAALNDGMDLAEAKGGGG